MVKQKTTTPIISIVFYKLTFLKYKPDSAFTYVMLTSCLELSQLDKQSGYFLLTFCGITIH